MPIGVIFVVALVTLAVCALLVIHMLVTQRKILKSGASGPHCGNCKYDLTGSDSNRCPECGKLFIEAGVVLPLGPEAVQRIRKLTIRAAVIVPVVLILLLSVVLLGTHAMVQAQRAAAAQARAAAVQAQAAAVAQFHAQQLLAASQPTIATALFNVQQQLAASQPARAAASDR